MMIKGPLIKDGLYYKIVDGEKKLLGENHIEVFVDGVGSQRYFLNGKLHKEDGPAIISSNGEYSEWYINGKQIHPVWIETRGINLVKGKE